MLTIIISLVIKTCNLPEIIGIDFLEPFYYTPVSNAVAIFTSSSASKHTLDQNSIDCNQDIDFLQLLHITYETISIALSCSELMYELTPFSNLHLNHPSSYCNDRKAIAFYTYSVCDKSLSRNCNLKQHIL